MTTSGCWEVTKVQETQADNQEKQTTESGNSTDDSADNKASKSDTSKQATQSTRKIDKKTQEVIDLQKTPAVPKIVIPEDGEPIYYDTQAWYKKNQKLTPLNLETVGSTPEKISEIISIDENSLDFISHSATKYRFMQSNQPYFDLVDSPNYLEIDWYYANPSDTDEEKRMSLQHAKKAHKFARQLMGDAGGQLVADMLAGKSVQDKSINDVKVSLAKCQFYSCMLVLKKPKPSKTIQAKAETNH